MLDYFPRVSHLWANLTPATRSKRKRTTRGALRSLGLYTIFDYYEAFVH